MLNCSGIYSRKLPSTIPCNIGDVGKLESIKPLRHRNKTLMECTTNKIDLMPHCLRNIRLFREFSDTCNSCLAQISSCIVINCKQECLGNNLYPQKCEICTEMSGCHIGECLSPTSIV